MTEDEFQKIVVGWLDHALPFGCIYHHSPNEGKRHVSYKLRLKKLGMKSGWPDIEIFAPTKYFFNGLGKPLFIELKAPKRGTISPAQKEVQKQLQDADCLVVTANKLSIIKAFLSHSIELKDNGNTRAYEELAYMNGA